MGIAIALATSDPVSDKRRVQAACVASSSSCKQIRMARGGEGKGNQGSTREEAEGNERSKAERLLRQKETAKAVSRFAAANGSL